VLAKDYATIRTRYQRLEGAFDQYAIGVPYSGETRRRHWHSLEGLLSVTWQTWCGFCRSVTLKSCLGTTTRGGLQTVPIPDVTDAARLAYITKALGRNEAIKPGKSLLPHNEPTWGDTGLLLGAVQHLRPTNEPSLASGLLTAVRAPGDMRRVRNAAAHVNSGNLLDVERLKVFYSGTFYAHPLDLLSWKTRDTGEYVYSVWLSELLDIADTMTQ
jgi:hypothetical protein